MHFLAILSALFQGVSSFLELPVPGLSVGSKDVTFGTLFLAFMLASLGISLFSLVFGSSGGGGDSPRTSSTRNPKIPKERRHDEF